MAKNKGKFGKGKVEIETEDEFVSGVNSFLGKLKPFAKQLVIGAIVLLVFVTGAVLYSMHKQGKEADATTLFNKAVAVYDEPVMSEEDRQLLATLNLPDMPEKVHPSIKARAEAALVHLDKMRSEFDGTDTVESARMFYAAVLYDAERFDDAVAMYQAVAKSGPAAQRPLAREGIGYALEAKALANEDAAARQQGLEAALDAFGKVQPKADGKYRDYTMYHQARVLQSLGRIKEAVDLYNQLLETLPTTLLRTEVNDRLAVLEAPAE